VVVVGIIALGALGFPVEMVCVVVVVPVGDLLTMGLPPVLVASPAQVTHLSNYFLTN
jgi:hypothetical protein